MVAVFPTRLSSNRRTVNALFEGEPVAATRRNQLAMARNVGESHRHGKDGKKDIRRLHRLTMARNLGESHRHETGRKKDIRKLHRLKDVTAEKKLNVRNYELL